MTPPRVVARERAAAGGCPSSGPAGPPSPKGEGRGCRGGIHPSRGVGGSGSLRGASGTPPPTGSPGMGGGGRSPLIRPCGATFPQGGRKGVVGEGFIPPGVLAAAQSSAGRRGRRPLRVARPRGLRRHPFPGRRAVGAGHARPGGVAWAGAPVLPPHPAHISTGV